MAGKGGWEKAIDRELWLRITEVCQGYWVMQVTVRGAGLLAMRPIGEPHKARH